MNKTKWIIILCSLVAVSCSEFIEEQTSSYPNETLYSIEIPANTIDKSKLKYEAKTSLWILNGERFSGYAISLYPDGTLKQKVGIFDGKKQNQTKDWYANGQLKHVAIYHQGKLHGEKKSWAPNPRPILISHLNYHLGKLTGEQKKWYSTGELYKVLNMNMGKEEGLQRAFRKNGALYANYEAHAGRIFGLKRAALCYDLEDEKIKYEK